MSQSPMTLLSTCLTKLFMMLWSVQVEVALRVQLGHLEALVAQPNFNGPQSSMESDVQSYR